jgi:hypothetical protein
MENKIMREKNVYNIGDVFVFCRRDRVMSVKRSLLVSIMAYPNPSLDAENKILYIRISEDLPKNIW